MHLTHHHHRPEATEMDAYQMEYTDAMIIPERLDQIHRPQTIFPFKPNTIILFVQVYKYL